MSQVDQDAIDAWCPPDNGDGDGGDGTGEQDRGQLLSPAIRSSVCQLGMRPLILTGALRHILIHLFSSASQIEEPDLRSYIWREGRDTSILIESVNKWRGDLVEFRPAVLIKRNPFRNVRLGIADRVGMTGETFDTYNTAWVGSHSIFCINGSGASTELLATEVQRGLLQFGPVIGEQLQLMKFQVTEIGAVSEVEEAKENFAIPITIGWAYQEQWELSRESMKLSNVAMEIDPTVI